MNFYTDILIKNQIRALKLAGKFISDANFYLGGGTAISIYLGHRQSLDFDWFINTEFKDPLKFAKKIKDAGIPLEVRSSESGTLHGTVYGVRFSFFEYAYPLLRPTNKWVEMNCKLAALGDLACMKLAAITQRGSKKDFVDIYALMKSNESLAQMLKLYKRKYGMKEISSLLFALAYFDDAETEQMPKMVWRVNWEEIKKEISQEVKRFEKQSHTTG
jgi:hypothetical protein